MKINKILILVMNCIFIINKTIVKKFVGNMYVDMYVV